MTAACRCLINLWNLSFVKISRSPDFDHFRSIEGLGETKSIPLDCRGFAASFAALRLKSCSVYLQRTFPRILQARYSTSGAFVVFPMDDAASLILNGVEGRAPALLLVKGNANCEIVEPQANLIGIVNFDNVDDRGWPCEVDSAQLVTTHPAEVRGASGDNTRCADARLAFAGRAPAAPRDRKRRGVDPAGGRSGDGRGIAECRRQAPEPEPLSGAGQEIRRVPCAPTPARRCTAPTSRDSLAYRCGRCITPWLPFAA